MSYIFERLKLPRAVFTQVSGTLVACSEHAGSPADKRRVCRASFSVKSISRPSWSVILRFLKGKTVPVGIPPPRKIIPGTCVRPEGLSVKQDTSFTGLISLWYAFGSSTFRKRCTVSREFLLK